MQTIHPRLAHLLDILLPAGTPVSVVELARRCGVSRRTIFREIENIGALLRPYGLSVSTKVNEGVYLCGGPEGKEKLRAEMAVQNTDRPSSRNERRTFLALDLLTFGEAQKLCYYSGIFQVSEATVSYDLNFLEEKLSRYGVTVLRKPGRSLSVAGGEAAVRNAICATLLEAKRNDIPSQTAYPSPDISDGINQLTETRFRQHLAWMTEESREAFALYMAVAVDRITSVNVDDEQRIEPEDAPLPGCLTVADFFANSLELRFSVAFSDWERNNLAVYLSALRRAANVVDESREAAGDFLLKSLTYQMIEHFDPGLAPFLKLDDRLVEGLTAHMQSAVVRIKKHIELYDPLYEEIARVYPDILEKSRRSLDVLRAQKYSDDITESEASFLATHFGAAVMRIREHRMRRLRVGVVCGSGIGTSYLLVSQLKKHFTSRAGFEICGICGMDDWRRFDLCVTSMPLQEIPIPAVRVNLLLDDADVEVVRSAMDSIASSETKEAAVREKLPLLELCENAGSLLSDVRALLTYFDTVTIESDCDFDRLAKLAGYRFGGVEESGRRIYEDIIKRESMSSQVVPDLELILLHTRTEGVEKPVFALIVPEGGRFVSPALQNSRCCVVMLAPLDASRDTLNLMGRISSALLEDALFLNAVLNGSYKSVYRGLEENFRDYMAANIIFRKD